ncbi:MAG: PAS domain S-box protein [Casimicrobiaceae bacterium]
MTPLFPTTVRDVFDDMPVPVLLVSPEGIVLYANAAHVTLIGVVEAEYLGRSLGEIGVDERSRDLVERLRRGEVVRDYALRLKRGDGALRDVLVDTVPVFDAGRLDHIRCFTRDVTARKRTEQALRASEASFRALVEQAPFSVQVFSPDGRIAMVNQAWKDLWGVEPGDIPEYNILADPQLDQKGIRGHLERAFAGQPVVIPPIAYDPNLTIPERSQHEDAVRWVGAVAYPLKDESGDVREVVLVHEDITARRKAEAALLESEGKLRLLADTIPQLAWMARADGHIFWYNRRWYEYTGTTPREMEGWGWQSVHDPSVLPQVLERWRGSVARGEPFDMVFPLRGADHVFRPFLTRVNPLRDAAGQIVYWCGTNTDISEIKRMEETLRETDRRKDEFLATLAHELRNPLAPIRNALQILKMPRVEGVIAQQTMGVMERQVEHLVRLVDDLLDVSRVMRGKIELRLQRLELAGVIARAVETAQPALDVQGHRLDLAVSDDSLAVEADPVRLAQVIGNLLANSAKYTDAKGRIVLWARRQEGEIVLGVRDNGIGIAPDMLPHVFDLFVQSEQASTRSHGGLGIGLTLVKNITEMHGGSVEARSPGLGCGSEFVIRLPAARPLQGVPTEIVVRSTDAHVAAGSTVLVIDDNRDAANSLAILLRLQGHAVQVAYDGATGIELAKVHHPGLVFLDIGMPGMDGYAVARRIRGTPGLEDVVLAALTGWGQKDDRRRTAEAGFDHHLVKPVDPSVVEALLAALGPRARRADAARPRESGSASGVRDESP